MSSRTINFDLDLCKKNYLSLATVKSLDSVIFKINIFENGLSKNIVGQTVTLYCKRSNNTVVEQKDNISISNNLITINVKNSCFQTTGKTIFELELKDNLGVIATLNFNIEVETRLNSQEILEATNEISGLNTVVENLNAKANQLDDKILETNIKLNNALDNITLTGSTTIKQIKEDYEKRLINAYETADYYFGDLGESAIENGECIVWIDNIFKEIISTDVNYQVFLTKYGPGDIWVSERNADFFVVKGTNDISFGWEIKGKRKGFENNRLEEYREEAENVQENNTI